MASLLQGVAFVTGAASGKSLTGCCSTQGIRMLDIDC